MCFCCRWTSCCGATVFGNDHCEHKKEGPFSLFTREDLLTELCGIIHPCFRDFTEEQKVAAFNGDDLIDLPLPVPPQVPAN